MNNQDEKPARCHRLLHTLALGIGSTLALFNAGAQAQVTFQLERINYAGGNVAIEFTDSRLLTDPNRAYALEHSDTLGSSNSWRYIYRPGATFSWLAPDKRTVTWTAPGASGFFRIGVDTDGDGLSDGMETRLGTNPNSPDSDGDGYNDLLELANSTDPSSAASRPLRGVQPEVQFVSQTSQALEGAGFKYVPVQFNTLYSGKLYYGVSAMSTAANGADFVAGPLGVVSCNGTDAFIPVEIKDDLEVENTEAIVLELNDDVAGTYHTGAFSTHTILLNDNDANWSGLLESGMGETSFRVCVVRSNAYVAATLVPSAKSSTNHQGGQLIPPPPSGQGGWPVTNLVFTATQFTGESVPVPAGSARLLGGVPLARQLYFSAIAPPPGSTNIFYLSKTNASVGHLMVGGPYVEVLVAAGSGTSALRLTNSGNFVLSRELPLMPPLSVPTTPR